MPAPALASKSGDSVGVSTKSPAGAADIEHIPDLHLIMQIAGNSAVGRAVHAAYAQHGDLQPSAYGGGRDRVLPGLPITIGQVDEHRNVLSRRDSWRRTAVGWFQDKGDDVGRLVDEPHHTIRTRRLRGIHVCLLVHPRLLGDQLQCEQPVDLTPGRGDLRCHRVAENLSD